MGRETVAAEDQHHSTDQFTGLEPPTANERTWELPGKQHDSEVQALGWDPESPEDPASSFQTEKVSNISKVNPISPYSNLIYSYTEAERIQKTVTKLEQKEEAKFMKQR